MRQKYPVEVAQGLVHKADDFAARLVEHYASGGSPWSRARSGSRGTESNLVLQARGKIGECAVAILFGLNPIQAVKWELAADKGTDIVLPSGLRADVKTTLPPFSLIWSNNVNDLYEQKQFDVLISVSIDELLRSFCWVEGWISKPDFFHRKRIADGKSGPRLEVGTWWMPKAQLNDIAQLFPPKLQARESIKRKQQFEFISGVWP